MKTKNIAALACVLSLPPFAASAQQSGDQDMLKRYCTSDYLEHCGEFAPGGLEVETCFRRNAKVLSANCSAAIVAYQQNPSAIRKVNAGR